MDINIPSKNDKRLKNFSQVTSFNRLSKRDSEISSALTAGGDKSYLYDDINDHTDDLSFKDS